MGFLFEDAGDEEGPCFDPEMQPPARVDLAEGTYIVGGAVSRLTSIEGALGGEQAGWFYGNGASNWFFAYGGDDTLRGRGGNDYLDDGEGDDIVYGDGGADFILSPELGFARQGGLQATSMRRSSRLAGIFCISRPAGDAPKAVDAHNSLRTEARASLKVA